MKSASPHPEARREKRLVAVGLVAATVLAVGGVLLLRSLLPPAGDLRIGDTTATVSELLGEPAQEYGSLAELMASQLASMGFVFTSLTGHATAPCKARDLPRVPGRALWFPFGATAGTLVYLDSQDRVTGVYSAGT